MKMTSRLAGACARLPVALGLAVTTSLAYAAPAEEARTLDTMVVTAAAPSSPGAPARPKIILFCRNWILW